MQPNESKKMSDSIDQKKSLLTLKQATFCTVICLGIVLILDVLLIFAPIALKDMVPNPIHWIGFVHQGVALLRDGALVCFFVFLFKRS